VLVLALLTACSDSAPTAFDSAVAMSLAAHRPNAHRTGESLVIQSQGAYAGVDGGTVATRGGSVQLTVDAGGPIPRFADSFISSVAVFGYAWADLATGAAIVSVLHPVIGRDSYQNPDGWHTHPVQLSGGTGASDFCIVSIGGSQAGIAIVGDGMNVTVPARWLPAAASDLDVVAAFIVQGEAGCAGTGLGVAVLAGQAL
jgi:hypothetical protein